MKTINASLKLEMDKSDSLIKENIALKEEISKFKSTAHEDLVKETFVEISKFKEIAEDKVESKNEELSKMSDAALNAMKAAYGEFNVSKMGEEADPITKPTQDLKPEDDEDKLMSKMADSDVQRMIKQRLNVRV